MAKVNKVFSYWRKEGFRKLVRLIALSFLDHVASRINIFIKRLNQEKVFSNPSASDGILLERNKVLRNIHSDKRCFIIGSGPSLKNSDLNLLTNEYFVGVNTAYLNDQLPKTNRSFWCTIDSFVLPFTDSTLPWLKALENSTSQETVYFFPVQAEALCRKYCLFTNREVHYLAFGDAIGIEEPDFAYMASRLDLCKLLISPHNIIETAITCAAYMGFRKIYLLGCDSDWFLYDNLDTKHFYSHDPNGFAETQNDDELKKDYFVMDTREKKLYYSFLLYRNYRLLKEALEQQGIEVFNASGGGMLDVFPKVEYESLFSSR